MMMTLGGRLQTRLVLLSSAGLLWTFAVSPLLARLDDISLRGAFQITLVSSIAMTILGLLWELVYHGLQQLRWDKDWPALLGLAAGFVEVGPVWLVVRALRVLPDGCTLLFALHFASTWLVVWLLSLGPIAVLQPRWRFEGGSFSRRPGDALLPFVVTNFGMALALVVLWFVSR